MKIFSNRTITRLMWAFLLLTTATTFRLHAQTCAPAPVGLVSWYAGDGNALDSRSRNNGTLAGATFGVGQNGQAFSFGGNSSTVNISTGLNDAFAALTIEAWVFPVTHGVSSEPTLGRTIISNTETDGFALRLLNGVIQADLRLSSGSINPTFGSSLPLNQWSHVAVTYDGAAVKAFLNGSQVGASISATGTITNTANAGICAMIGNDPTIGCAIQSSGFGFDGRIDELSIYNRALSAPEIQAIFNAGTAGKCKPTATVSPSGQVGWWSGDGNTNDIAGANNGTLQNGAGFGIGKVGQGFQFANTQHVEVPDSASLDLTNAITLETWVSPQQVGGAGNNTILLFKGNISVLTQQSYGMFYNNDGTVTFRVCDGSTCLNAGNGLVLPLNTFSHIVGTWDGTTVRFYVNGVLTNSFPFSLGTIFNTTDPLIIGSNAGTFVGKMDEVSIYNRAITQDEVTSIFNAGIAGKLKQNATINTSSSVSIWQGEGNANDSRGANNGTFTANTYAAGKVGQAFSLDGTDDSVGMGLVQSTQVFSLEAWVSPLSAVNDPINQELILGDGVTSIVIRKIGGVDRPVFQYRDSTNNAFEQVIGTTAIPLNTFTHLAGTYDGVTLRLYVNGVLNNQSTPTNLVVANCLSNYFIGGFPAGTLCGIPNSPFQFFNGRIDESASYNRSLSPTEVRANYEAGNALSTVVGDARVTFPTVSTAGITQQIPLNLSLFPSLPISTTATGLTYDIATTATFTGSPQVCFNVPSVTTSPAFFNLRILHLESNVWVNRTDLLSINFATRTICTTGLTSLSPFAITSGATTAASVSIGGRVLTADGNGIHKARIGLIDSEGNTRTAQTNPFGYYRFDEVAIGESYVLTVKSKQYEFETPAQTVVVTQATDEINFVALGQNRKEPR